MKKIISLGIASAVLALSAVSAFADAASDTTPAATASINITLDKTEAAVGDTVTATISAGSAFEGLGGNITFDGLTLAAGATGDSISASASKGTTIYNADATPNRLSVASYPAYAEGDVLAVIPLTVVSDNPTASIQFTADADYGDVVASATVTVAAAAPDESTDSEPTESSEPVESSTPDDGGLTPVEPVESVTPVESTDNNTTTPSNPETGVALAVIPAIIAGAAVVVAKKRK